MEEVKELMHLLLYPYHCLENMLGLDEDPLILAYIVAALLTISSLLLRIARYRRLSRIMGILALLSMIPPLLCTIYSFLNIFRPTL